MEPLSVFSVSTEMTLIKRLTKINRMDIVHLIETRIINSTQEETSSHTYAEIEQTIALDHSEGAQASITLQQVISFLQKQQIVNVWIKNTL